MKEEFAPSFRVPTRPTLEAKDLVCRGASAGSTMQQITKGNKILILSKFASPLPCLEQKFRSKAWKTT